MFDRSTKASLAGLLLAGLFLASAASAQDAAVSAATKYVDDADTAVQEVGAATEYYNSGDKGTACSEIRGAGELISDTMASYDQVYNAVSADETMSENDRTEVLNALPGIQQKLTDLHERELNDWNIMC